MAETVELVLYNQTYLNKVTLNLVVEYQIKLLDQVLHRVTYPKQNV